MTKQKPTLRRPSEPVSVVDDPVRVRVVGQLSISDVRAIANCRKGIANPEQQKQAIDAIVYSIARLPDNGFYLDGEDGRRESDFCQGMRHVGSQILHHSDFADVTIQRIKTEPSSVAPKPEIKGPRRKPANKLPSSKS